MNTMLETYDGIPYHGYNCECSARKSVTHWSEDIEPCFHCEQTRHFCEIETEMNQLLKRMINIGYNVGVEVSEDVDVIFEAMQNIKFKINA